MVMHEWLKKQLGITEPQDHSEIKAVETWLDEVEQQTERVLLRSRVQTARVSRVMPSWEEMYLHPRGGNPRDHIDD
jgi:hypothetical protein